ncbi:MAG: hypothetical protein ACR2OC_11840 [Solirubrobacterales bacterium]
MTRIKRTAGLIGALALVVAVSVVGLALADGATQGSVTQTLDATVSPSKKLPKKDTKKVDPKGVKLNVAVGIRDSSGLKPPPATQVDIDLSKDLTFTTKGLSQCDQNAIATSPTAAAKSTCKKAIVGEGSASATCSGNTNPPDIPDVTVTAFNGKQQGKNPVLLLHTYASLGGTDQIQILPGVLVKSSGDFGKTLKVTVPPLAGGACSIIDFETTVGTTFKSKGETFNYVGATCGNGEMKFGSEFTYVANSQGVNTLAPKDTVACTSK